MRAQFPISQIPETESLDPNIINISHKVLSEVFISKSTPLFSENSECEALTSTVESTFYSFLSRINNPPDQTLLESSAQYLSLQIVENLLSTAFEIDRNTGRLDLSSQLLNKNLEELYQAHKNFNFSKKCTLLAISKLQTALVRLVYFQSSIFLLLQNSNYSLHPNMPAIKEIIKQNVHSPEELCFTKELTLLSLDEFLARLLPQPREIVESEFVSYIPEINSPRSFVTSIFKIVSVLFQNYCLISHNLPPDALKSHEIELESAWKFWERWVSELIEFAPNNTFSLLSTPNANLIFKSSEIVFLTEDIQTKNPPLKISTPSIQEIDRNSHIYFPCISIVAGIYSEICPKLDLSHILKIEQLLPKQRSSSISPTNHLWNKILDTFSNRKYIDVLTSSSFLKIVWSFTDISLGSEVCALLSRHIEYYLTLRSFTLHPNSFAWFISAPTKPDVSTNLLFKLCNINSTRVQKSISTKEFLLSDRALFWKSFYNKILLLWDHGNGPLGQIPKSDLAKSVYKSILWSEDYQTAELCLKTYKSSHFTDPPNSPHLTDSPFEISPTDAADLILEVSQEISNNSLSGNIESPDIIRALKCLELIKSSPEAILESQFLEGVHLLWTLTSPEVYDLYKLSENFANAPFKAAASKEILHDSLNKEIVPMRVRSAKQVPEILQETLALSPKAYKKPRILREAARLLGYIPESKSSLAYEPKKLESSSISPNQNILDLGMSIAKMGKRILNTAQRQDSQARGYRGATHAKGIESIEEAYVVSLLLDSAIKNNDHEAAYEFVKQLEKVSLLKTSNSNLVELIWQQVYRLANMIGLEDYKQSDIMSLAIQICPIGRIGESVNQWESIIKKNSAVIAQSTPSPFEGAKNSNKAKRNCQWWNSASLDFHGLDLDLDVSKMISGDCLQTSEEIQTINKKSEIVVQNELDQQGSPLSRNLPVQNKGNPLKKNDGIGLTKDHLRTTDNLIVEKAFGTLLTEGPHSMGYKHYENLLFEWLDYRFSFERNVQIYLKKKQLDEYMLKVITCDRTLALKTISFLEASQSIRVMDSTSMISLVNFKNEDNAGDRKSSSYAEILYDFCALLEGLYTYTSSADKASQIKLRVTILKSISEIFVSANQNSINGAKFFEKTSVLSFFVNTFDMKYLDLRLAARNEFWNYALREFNILCILKYSEILARLVSVFEWENSNPSSLKIESNKQDIYILHKLIFLHFEIFLSMDNPSPEYLTEHIVSLLNGANSDYMASFLFEQIVISGPVSNQFVDFQTRINIINIYFEEDVKRESSSNLSIFGKHNYQIFVQTRWILILQKLSMLQDPFNFTSVDFNKWVTPLEPYSIVSKVETFVSTVDNLAQPSQDKTNSGSFADEPNLRLSNTEWISFIEPATLQLLENLLLERESLYFILSTVVLAKQFLLEIKSGSLVSGEKVFNEALRKLVETPDDSYFASQFDFLVSEITDLGFNSQRLPNIPSDDKPSFTQDVPVSFETMLEKEISDTYMLFLLRITDLIANNVVNIIISRKLTCVESVILKYPKFLLTEDWGKMSRQEFYLSVFKLIASEFFSVKNADLKPENLTVIISKIFYNTIVATNGTNKVSPVNHSEKNTYQTLKFVELLVVLGLISSEHLETLLTKPVPGNNGTSFLMFDLLRHLLEEKLINAAYQLEFYLLSRVLDCTSSNDPSPNIEYGIVLESIKVHINQPRLNQSNKASQEIVPMFLLFLFCMSKLQKVSLQEPSVCNVILDSISLLGKAFSNSNKTLSGQLSQSTNLSCSKKSLLTIGVMLACRESGSSFVDKICGFDGEKLQKVANLEELANSVLQLCLTFVQKSGLLWSSTISNCYSDLFMEPNEYKPGSSSLAFEPVTNYFMTTDIFSIFPSDMNIGELYANIVPILLGLGDLEAAIGFAKSWHTSNSLGCYNDHHLDQKPTGLKFLSELFSEYKVSFNLDRFSAKADQNSSAQKFSRSVPELEYTPDLEEANDGWDLELELELDLEPGSNMDIQDQKHTGIPDTNIESRGLLISEGSSTTAIIKEAQSSLNYASNYFGIAQASLPKTDKKVENSALNQSLNFDSIQRDPTYSKTESQEDIIKSLDTSVLNLEQAKAAKSNVPELSHSIGLDTSSTIKEAKPRQAADPKIGSHAELASKSVPSFQLDYKLDVLDQEELFDLEEGWGDLDVELSPIKNGIQFFDELSGSKSSLERATATPNALPTTSGNNKTSKLDEPNFLNSTEFSFSKPNCNSGLSLANDNDSATGSKLGVTSQSALTGESEELNIDGWGDIDVDLGLDVDFDA